MGLLEYFRLKKKPATTPPAPEVNEPVKPIKVDTVFFDGLEVEARITAVDLRGDNPAKLIRRFTLAVDLDEDLLSHLPEAIRAEHAVMLMPGGSRRSDPGIAVENRTLELRRFPCPETRAPIPILRVNPVEFEKLRMEKVESKGGGVLVTLFFQFTSGWETGRKASDLLASRVWFVTHPAQLSLEV